MKKLKFKKIYKQNLNNTNLRRIQMKMNNQSPSDKVNFSRASVAGCRSAPAGDTDYHEWC